jgi:hypothetical protein
MREEMQNRWKNRKQEKQNRLTYICEILLQQPVAAAVHSLLLLPTQRLQLT